MSTVPTIRRRTMHLFYRRCVAAAVLLGTLAAVLIVLDGAPPAALLMEISFFIVPALAGIACIRRARPNVVDKVAWRWLGGACFVWSAGGAVWAYQAIVPQSHPFPSLADVGFIGYVMPAVVGLVLLRSRSLANRAWLWWLLDACVIATAVLFISWTTVLGGLVSARSTSEFVGLVGLAYPVVDVILMSFVLALGMRHTAGTRLPWLLLGGGFTTLAVTDSAYVSQITQGAYAGGHLFDIGWTIAFVLVGLAAYAPTRAPATADDKRITVGHELLPYVPVFVVIVMAAQTPVTLANSPFLSGVGSLLLVLVALRQVVVAWEKTARVNDMDRLVEARTHELEGQREFLVAVLDSLEDGVAACDANGVITVFNDIAGVEHDLMTTAIPHDQWTAHFSLRRADGVTLLPTEDIPLLRALGGEVVANQEFVIAPPGGPRRLMRANGRSITGQHGELLGAVVALHDITESRRAQVDLEHQVFHDNLTGLSNRAQRDAGLGPMLLHAEAMGEPLAALLIDLDNFKQVNDLFGHTVGDELLVEVSRRLRGCVRGRDLSVRLGGDEFVFVLEDTGSEGAIAVARRMLSVLAAPVVVAGSEVLVSASIGVAKASAGTDARSVLRRADLAMYEAKRTGGNKAVMFHASMQVLADARLSLESDMRTGLRDGEFGLVYQPVVNLITGDVTGVEALCRWNPPGRPGIPPVEFIPVAEQTGLIVPLGEWVLLEACRQLLLWDKALPAGPHLTMAVNVSLAQLDSPGFLQVLEKLLASTGLPPKRLVIEITESALRDDARTSTVLQAFHDLGVSVSIDDFGTGYSSLGRLHNTSVDNVKLDRSFVADITGPNAQVPLLEAMITMADLLGLSTIAEGIETVEQLDYLAELGCDEGQGYLMSPPIPAAAVLDLVRTSPWHPPAIRLGGPRDTTPPALSAGGAVRATRRS